MPWPPDRYLRDLATGDITLFVDRLSGSLTLEREFPQLLFLFCVHAGREFSAGGADRDVRSAYHR